MEATLHVSLFPPAMYRLGEGTCPRCDGLGKAGAARELSPGKWLVTEYGCLVCRSTGMVVGPRQAMTYAVGQ